MEAIWNQGNYEQIETFVAPEYTIRHDPGDQWEGQTLDHATFKERVQYSRNAFPDLKFTILDMVAEGNKVTASWTMSGTQQGELAGAPASGRPLNTTGITIYDFENGKVRGHWQAYDRLTAVAQLGLLENLG